MYKSPVIVFDTSLDMTFSWNVAHSFTVIQNADNTFTISVSQNLATSTGSFILTGQLHDGLGQITQYVITFSVSILYIAPVFSTTLPTILDVYVENDLTGIPDFFYISPLAADNSGISPTMVISGLETKPLIIASISNSQFSISI